MGRKSDREEDVVDRLERENRELKAANRVLLRRLKKIDKGYRAKVELTESNVQKLIDKSEEKKTGNCPACRESDLKDINLGVKTFETCKCGYRIVKKV